MSGEIKIWNGAVVCQEAELEGDIEIGKGTIIHPSVRIMAIAGPVVIGENNVIEERVLIKNCTPNSVLSIGNNNKFEVGSIVTAPFIGNCNVVEVKASVGPACTLANGCIVGSRCSIDSMHLNDREIVYGEELIRETTDVNLEERSAELALQRSALAELLPKALKTRAATSF